MPDRRAFAVPLIVVGLAGAAAAAAPKPTPTPAHKATPSPAHKGSAPAHTPTPHPSPSATPAPSPTPPATPTPTPPTATLAPLEFLVGSWEGAGGGAPGEASGGFTFAKDLQGRIITRTSHADYPAAGGRPAFRHDDLMIFYVEGSAIRADYFDSEGNAIRYRVEPRGDGEVVLLGEAPAAAPRYRLTYRMTPEQLLEGRFEIAPPATPEAFKPYLTWSARRAGKARGNKL